MELAHLRFALPCVPIGRFAHSAFPATHLDMTETFSPMGPSARADTWARPSKSALSDETRPALCSQPIIGS